MSSNFEPLRRPAKRVSAEELARRQGVRPVKDVRDLACPDLFDSDEEVDEFLAMVRAMRQADIG